MKVVVIGCTHAGTAAVKSILKNHPEAEVTVYERNDNISFLSCGIALYVGGVVKDPAGLFYSNPEELSSLGATVKMEHDVTDVDTENKTVTAKDLKTGETETVSYDKLVMTTGSWPIIPPDILEKELTDRGVTLALGENVTEFITDEEGKVKQVATPTDTFDTDMVILCVGFRPNTKLIEGKVDTLPNGAIKVNEYMETSNPDIFAAGDSAVVNYNPSGTQNYIPLATNAVRQGLLVGNNLTDHKMAYRGTQGTSGLYLFGWTIGSTGVTKESATLNDLEVQATVFEDNYRPEFMPTTEKVMMELVYEKGTNRIVGAQFMSKYDITQSANTMSLAVQNKMTVEDLALSDFFFQPHFDRPWNYLNLLAQAALGEIETAQ